jgi:uncharacterized protein
MSAADATEVDPYAPPDDATVNRAIEDFARAVREAYGDRVKGIYLFGSRARGDHKPESDADVAVVLDDRGDWNMWKEKMRLAGLEYDVIVETGADVQGWPVRDSEWRAPETHRNPSLIVAMRRDARIITVRA